MRGDRNTARIPIATLAGIPVSGPSVGVDRYAARRSPSNCRSHPSSWFQLTKMRLTKSMHINRLRDPRIDGSRADQQMSTSAARP